MCSKKNLALYILKKEVNMIPEFYDETERAIWAAAFAKGHPQFHNWNKHTAAQHANEILQGYRELKPVPNTYRYVKSTTII